MAVGTGNPFYIEPATANINPILQGVGGLFKEKRAERDKLANSKKLMETYKSGDPDAIASMISSNPELGAQLSSMIGFKNKATEDNYSDTIRRIASTSSPEERGRALVDRIDYVTEQGGNPVQSVMMLDELTNRPENFEKALDVEFARTQGKQAWDAYKAQRGGAQKDDFKEQSLQIKRDTLEMRKLEAKLRAEDNELKREKLRLDIDAKREKIDSAKKGIQQKAKADIRQQGSLSTAIDDFMANDSYMNSVSGWRGRTPAVSDTGVEAEAYFDNIKNNLTLENLDKMSGVLSETDIKILSTAATALQKGMSRKAITSEMKKIKDVLKTKSESVQKQILESTDPDANAQSSELSPEEQAELEKLRAMKAGQNGR